MNSAVTVSIAHYKGRKWIEDAVRSVGATRPTIPYEIIIGDDASPDDADIQKLKYLEKTYPHVSVVYSPINRGDAATRNMIAEASKSPYILTLDQDDVFSEDAEFTGSNSFLDRAWHVMETRPDVVICYSKFSVFERENRPYFFIPPCNEKSMLTFNRASCFTFYRRDEALAVGGYNPEIRHASDWGFVVALLNQRLLHNRKSEFHRFEEPYFGYRRRADCSSMTDNCTASYRTELEQIIKMAPNIYRRHYPGLTDTQIADRLETVFNKGYLVQAVELAKECILHPARANREKTFHYVAERLAHRLSRLFNAAQPNKSQAVSAPSFRPDL